MNVIMALDGQQFAQLTDQCVDNRGGVNLKFYTVQTLQVDEVRYELYQLQLNGPSRPLNCPSKVLNNLLTSFLLYLESPSIIK
jgi:hypothetical protein